MQKRRAFPISVSIYQEHDDHIQTKSRERGSNASAYIQKLIEEDMKRGTYRDYERILAFKPEFTEALIHISQNGKDVSSIETSFAGYFERTTGKSADLDQIRSFLHEKVMIFAEK